MPVSFPIPFNSSPLVSPLIFNPNHHDMNDRFDMGGIHDFGGQPESTPKVVRHSMFGNRSHSTPPDNSLDSSLYYEHHQLTLITEELRRVERDFIIAQEHLNGLRMELQEARETSDEMKEQLMHLQSDISRSMPFDWNISSHFPNDTLSNVEVVRAVECINEEIERLSSVGTVHVKSKHIVNEQDKKNWMHHLKPIFHHSVLHFLLQLRCRNPDPIRLGWRATMVYCCSKLVCNMMKKGAHTSSNVQSVAERWRMMSPGEVFNTISPGERDRAIKGIADTLLALPLLCGYIVNPKVYDEMHSTFRQNMRPLVHKCVELAELLISAGSGNNFPPGGEMRPYIQHSGDRFNSGRAEVVMVGDTWEDAEGTIACTLDMGLCWAKKREYYEQDKRGPSVKAQPIVKAGVMLLSTFENWVSVSHT